MSNLNDYRHSGCYVPTHIHNAIRAYVDDHIRPGHFLQAVIRNDLNDAVCRADTENRTNLVAISSYFYNETPRTCWGSKKALDAWVARGDEGEEVAT